MGFFTSKYHQTIYLYKLTHTLCLHCRIRHLHNLGLVNTINEVSQHYNAVSTQTTRYMYMVGHTYIQTNV